MQESSHKSRGIIIIGGNIHGKTVLAMAAAMESLCLACDVSVKQFTESVHELHEHRKIVANDLNRIAVKVDCSIILDNEYLPDEKRFYNNYCKKPTLIIMKNGSIKRIKLCIRSPDYLK